MASSVRGKGLTTLTERLVLDCQRLSRTATGNFPVNEWSNLERQIRKFIRQFTSRQMSLCLSSIARIPFPISGDRRRLVLQLTENLNTTELTLKDFAAVLNSFAKMNIKNEIFLTNSIPFIIRKLRASSPSISVPAVVLILDSYSRLGFFGDGQVVDETLRILNTHKESLSHLDAVSVIRAISRLPTDIIDRNKGLEFVDHLLSSLTDASRDLKLSVIVSVSKFRMSLSPCLSLLIEDILAAGIEELRFYQLVNACNAFSLISPSHAVTVSSVIHSKLSSSGNMWREECSNVASSMVLLLSAMTRLNEQLPLTEILSVIDSVSQTDLGVAGLCVLVNLHATINLQFDGGIRALVEEAISNGKIEYSCHTFSVFVNSLAKLDEIELLLFLFDSVSGQTQRMVREMTEQGHLMTLLGASYLIDSVGHRLNTDNMKNLMTWYRVLYDRVPVSTASEGISQLGIISAIAKTNPLIRKSGCREITFPDRKERDSKVSSFQQQVVDSVRLLTGGPAYDLHVNAVEPVTGYEMDISFQ